MGATNVFTYTLDGTTLTVGATDNVQRISVICSSGLITIQGSSVFQGLDSTPLTLATNQGITLQSKNDNNPIVGVTIDATSGIADLVISTQ